AKVHVSKAAAFYSASLLLIGGYLLFVAGVGYYIKYFGGSWGGALQVALLACAMVALTVLVLSGSLRARLRVFLGKHFFSYRYDYRVEWLRFTAMLSSRGAPQDVGSLVVRGLADMVECPAGALWFKALGDEAYAQSATWNMPALATKEPVDSAFCRFVREREWIVDLGAARSGTGPREEAKAVPPWLAELEQAWLVVPLLAAQEMLGFVVLAKPRAQLELNWEVRDLLKTAARQAAAFLAQIHAAEALVEARKFEAFNRMSAFVVHDLKNIVTQLSLMLKNAERHRDNPEFQQDMLATVGSSLERMKQMMVQLREGNRPAGATLGVDLAPIVQRLEASAAQRGRAIDVDIRDRVATRGHEQRLERVVGHVVQNALDATAASGKVWVRLSQDAGRALLVVGDSGVGMSDEFVRTQLFRPFVTTKAGGMGIGSYESLQYLRELGGGIAVDSQLGRGTVVTLTLPLFHSHDDSVMRTQPVA
ncbi:MAG: PEP-CTERM system histidine kinase PrsK, partial [Burkholderiales bacterium]|nr:PEP-CTERM system histidine kinase PrsK [Burkholderiales bacterium]